MTIKQQNQLGLWLVAGLGLYLVYRLVSDNLSLPVVTNTGNMNKLLEAAGRQ